MKIFVNTIFISLLSMFNALPQWNQLKVDRLDKNGFTLLKKYNFNKALSGSGIAGYDKTKGLGFGLHGTHKFGSESQVSGGLYKSEHGGWEKTLGLKHTFKSTGTSLFGKGNYGPNFQSHTIGIGQNIGKKTSIVGSQTSSNYGGYKVNSVNLGISHKLKSGGTIKAFGGHNTFNGPSFGLGLNIPLGRKK